MYRVLTKSIPSPFFLEHALCSPHQKIIKNINKRPERTRIFEEYMTDQQLPKYQPRTINRPTNQPTDGHGIS